MTQTVLLAGAGLLAVVAILRILRGPVGTVLRLGANTGLGFGALYLTHLTAGATGVALGLNPWNALVIGILGLPGFAFLLLTQWTLQ